MRACDRQRLKQPDVVAQGILGNVSVLFRAKSPPASLTGVISLRYILSTLHIFLCFNIIAPQHKVCSLLS